MAVALGLSLLFTLAHLAQSSPLGLHSNRIARIDVDLRLSLGISSLARVSNDNQIEERQIEISWWSIDYQTGDEIVLFDYESDDKFCQADSFVVEKLTIDSESSWLRLNTSMPYFEHQDLVSERCLHYWAGYRRLDGQLVACNCLKPRPNWMGDIKERIQSGLLREIYLPGTHDAAAYERYRGNGSNNLATKYAITQNEDLFNQLAFGVRYLDMRIIFRPTDEQHRFWTHHGSYLLRPLINDTALVREFVSQTDEIVIFDIHELSNMSNITSIHQELQSLLIEEFGDYMAPYSNWNATLSDFWSTGKRLLVTYDSFDEVNSPMFWPAVKHQWGNVQSVDDLETYLEGVMAKAANDSLEFPWSAMVELTPTAEDVALDRFDGLRNAADLVNRNVTAWFRDRWSPLATIVAHDFFLGANTVDLALAENQRRFP